MTIAEFIADQLFRNGVRRVFGIPGGPSIPYMEAFRCAGIEFILTSNEASAGIMADVTARLTGIPGVCHATFGPGATNISTGIGGAFLDRSPVIVFTSEMGDSMINRTTQMNINHQKLFEPLAKATFRLDAGNASRVIMNALRLCREEYPGPVHIGLPADIAGQQAAETTTAEGPADQPVMNQDANKAIAMLREAKRPLLAVGLTSSRLGIQKQLLGFLETFSIPVVLTPMAKGLIPEAHPCYAGVLFHALSNRLDELFRETDLVIGLGYDPVEFNYESWMPPVPLVHFDTRITDMPDSVEAIQVFGNPAEWFGMLNNLDRNIIEDKGNDISRIRMSMNEIFEGLRGHFGAVSALGIMQEELPTDTVLSADVGSHLHLAGQYWQTYGRNNLIMTNGWSGMGFGLPASLAVAFADPACTPVCLTGDGGFLMMAGEMITARRYNLPVIVVVFSDGELNLIRVKQSWKNLSPNGTLLYEGDLFGSDIFLGIKVLRADSSGAMRLAVREALRMREPVIINAVIDPSDYSAIIVRR